CHSPHGYVRAVPPRRSSDLPVETPDPSAIQPTAPSPAPVAAAPVATPVAPAARPTRYGEVRSGETLSQIARDLDLSVNLDQAMRSEEHTSELQARENLVCRL